MGAAGCGLFLLLGREGFLCVFMAMPVVLPLALLGSLLTYRHGNWANRKQPVAMSLLIPLSMLFDVNAKPPVLLRLDQHSGERRAQSVCGNMWLLFRT